MINTSTSANENPYICSSHKGKKISYCLNCRSAICDKCIKDHTKLKHNIRDFDLFVKEFKEYVGTCKFEISKKAGETLKYLEKYKEEMQTDFTYKLNIFRTQLNQFLHNVNTELDTKENEIYNELGNIIETLKNDIECREYDFELRMLEEISETGDKSKINNIDMNAVKKKFQAKEIHLNKALEISLKLDKKRHNLIHECNGFYDFIKYHNGITMEKLSEIYREKLETINKAEADIQDYNRKINELIDLIDKLKADAMMITEEKSGLKESFQQLKVKRDVINFEIENKELQVTGFHNQLRLLTSEISERMTKMKILDEVIKCKTNIANNLSNGKKSKEVSTITFKEKEKLSSCSFIYIINQNAGKIYVYNFDKQKSTKIMKITHSIMSHCGSIQILDSLYLSGGFDITKSFYTKQTTEISIAAFSSMHTEQKADMILEKSNHKLVAVNMAVIYSIGGNTNGRKGIETCEKYDIANNKWEYAPSLSRPEYNVSACTLDEIIYVFFRGSKCEIEALDTRNTKPFWEKINFPNQGKCSFRTEMGCFPISEKSIIICGGCEDCVGSTSDVLIVNLKEKAIGKSKTEMNSKDWFSTGTPIRLKDGKIYITGTHKYGIHIFDTEKMTWSLLSQKEWK